MKRQFTLLFFCLFFIANIAAQREETDNQSLFKGRFYNKEERVNMALNLYQPTLCAPGMEFLGKLHGYLNGNIYGIWLLTSFEIKGKEATLRFSNDQGADAQTIKLIAKNDSTFEYHAINGNCIRKVNKRKLVKIPSEMTFIKL